MLNRDKPMSHNGADTSATSDTRSAADREHDNLLARLKSRISKMEAESLREFMARYRASVKLDKEDEAYLDRQLKLTETRAESLLQRSENLRVEVAEAERAVERVNHEALSHKSADAKVQPMTAFERSQYLINENKRMEDLQHQRDEATGAHHKVQRQLHNELIDLQDCKVLLSEYRRLRLDKLEECLGRVSDGRKLRQVVREMIRQGGQRVLSRLESSVPLESWMCEVLVNCCHLEISIENAKKHLLPLQREALVPLKAQVETMVAAPKESRHKRLCEWTWDDLRDSQDEANPWRRPPNLVTGASVGGVPAGSPERSNPPAAIEARPGAPSGPGPSATSVQREAPDEEQHLVVAQFASEDPEVLAREAEVEQLQKLLEDTRQNAVAVICSRIRQSGMAARGGESAMDWGKQMLTMMVSEEFAKAATNEMRKSQPQALLHP